MKTPNTRVSNLKAKPTLTKCLIGAIQNYKQQTKLLLKQLVKSDDLSWKLKTSGECIFEYDLRVQYAKQALGIIATQGFDSLKPYLQNELVCLVSSRGNSTSDLTNVYFKTKAKVVAELISDCIKLLKSN